MLEQKTIAVVIPAYNEESQIHHVLESMPEFVDRIIVVDDCSTDKTSAIVLAFMAAANKNSQKAITRREIPLTKFNRADRVLQDMSLKEKEYYTPAEIINQQPDTDRIIFIKHTTNGGVGAAIASGYKWCVDHRIDCTAVMAGDGQMDPAELESICHPVIYEDIDYVKGNRLIHRSAWLVIPKTRYLGNSILSILTKIASGYWQLMDPQNGYTAISSRALERINLDSLYPRYGYCNDLLVKLNVNGFRIKNVPHPARYGKEKSGIKYSTYIVRVSKLLLKDFLWRLKTKYMVLSFHPLVFFYIFGALLTGAGVISGIYTLYHKFIEGGAFFDRAIISLIVFGLGIQLLFF